ncbi:MAG: hypothetical protein EU529_11505 [Promethearchaeota archaeon]|nr:MAG: hypothetical protein EU529_11505 [Candidatus Lokiarchaeota archaeon]
MEYNNEHKDKYECELKMDGISKDLSITEDFELWLEEIPKLIYQYSDGSEEIILKIKKIRK